MNAPSQTNLKKAPAPSRTPFPSHLEYTRRLSFRARAVGAWAFEVHARLDDAEHRIVLDLLVDARGSVQAAYLDLAEAPFPACHHASHLARRLVGLDLRDAPTRSLPRRLAGADGCFHVLELAEPALRFARNVLASLDVGWDAMHPPGHDTRRRMEDAGLTECLAFTGEVDHDL